MKIRAILNEDEDFGRRGFDIDSAGPSPFPAAPRTPTASATSFSDLSSLQVHTLKALASGRLDIETASEKQLEQLTDLQDLGLLDTEFGLTPEGNKVISIAAKVGGGQDMLAARARDQAPAMDQDIDDVEGDLDIDADEFSVQDDDGADDFNFDLGDEELSKF